MAVAWQVCYHCIINLKTYHTEIPKIIIHQTVFKRYEIKYLLNQEQKARILKAMEPYMALDSYGRTTIRNLYFDTGNYRLIRHSIEKPVYKEKLRIRSYRQATPESPVFVELKKKYKSLVYKRRLSMPEAEAMAWVAGRASLLFPGSFGFSCDL